MAVGSLHPGESMESEASYDVVVVGGGIAGLTAALYLARQNLRTLVVTMDIGGQLLLATEIQNYPGVKSIDGFSLAKMVEEQARAFGAEIKLDEVSEIEKAEGSYRVKTVTGATYEAEALILAFGKKPKELGVPGERRLKGRGVSYCATCDAPLFKGRKVALAAIGHHGIEAASMLASQAREVYWVFPAETPGGERELYEAIASKPNVKAMPKSKITEILGESTVKGVVIETPEGEVQLEVDGVFIEIGYTPETGIVRELVELNERGEVIVDRLGRTSAEGVFAAGDVTDLPYKQAVISAAAGAIAALSAYRYLMEKRGRRIAVAHDWKKMKLKGEEASKPSFFLTPSG